MISIDEELILAASANNRPEVSRLSSVGADVNAKGSFGWTPLHWASLKGHVHVVIELLGHGADIDVKGSGRWTPLHWACRKGHLAVVTELLNRGANIEAKTNQGGTPLHLAGDHYNFPVVKALVAFGADMLAVNNYGERPIDVAVDQGNSEVTKYLLQQLYATTLHLPLHALLKNLTWISSLFSRDAPPLRAALDNNVLATDDVVEILEYLVDQNPDSLASCDQYGSLPLHVACRRGASFTIIQSLVDLYKPSVKSVTYEGDLPLFLACEITEPSLDTIFLLMKLYPDLVYRYEIYRTDSSWDCCSLL
jgi:ankyrin repeat protein